MIPFRLTIAAGLAVMALAGPAFGAGDRIKPPAETWSFSGPFGRFDQAQLQRGFKVVKEVCASCHSMNL
ncbi:MAG: cytochrome c1, partial [Bosea sp.]|nr:cytochrome c1 [Bosea sp. (in: a-proteobacteria)]